MNIHPEILKSIASHLSTLSFLIGSLADDPARNNESGECPPEQAVSAREEQPAMTLVDLRKKLVGYSQAGYDEEIRKVLADHGVRLLSKLAPEEYEAVLQEVRQACD